MPYRRVAHDFDSRRKFRHFLVGGGDHNDGMNDRTQDADHARQEEFVAEREPSLRPPHPA
ncbi:hypothetical protein FRUB_03582 [Fimbriiglobus ruber]|uniref:Uncharacterized protein n=1 Tax=Fimbriiglobus ruber TaxID=1908690 RepID=A0A225DSE2_9BACT|nr:hypothetical protein FRUB_03582 [Fimbriiglobus ruber]